MVRKNRGMHGFVAPSWVLITTYNISPPVIVHSLVGSKGRAISVVCRVGRAACPPEVLRSHPLLCWCCFCAADETRPPSIID